MELNTQNSSRARVKNDSIGEDRMVEINKSFTSASRDDFLQMCEDAINASSGKDATKLRTCDALKRCATKAKMLFIVTNYFLAGEGKGV